MRVLFVDHSGAPGGGQLGLLRYASIRSEHLRTYLFLGPGTVLDSLRSRGLNASAADFPAASVRDLYASRRLLRRCVEQANVDLVVANSLRSAVALAWARPDIPMVYYMRQDMSPKSMGRTQRTLARLTVFPAYRAFLANSRWTASVAPPEVRRRVLSTPAYPLCDADGLTTVSSAARTGEALRFLWMGRLVEWKGLDVVLKAMSILERRGVPVSLTVAGAAHHGDPRYVQRIQSRASQLRARPRFLGHVDDVGSVLSSHHILIHSSIIPEPFGQVVVQGMAAGLAVVATSCGGPVEIIEDGVDGLLVKPSDPVALAAALIRLRNDSVLRESMRIRGRRKVLAEFSDRQLAGALDRLLLEAVG